MNVVYILRRFPKTSETFVLNEISEVLRQGDRVTIFSLKEPHQDEPFHPGAAKVAPLVTYLPDHRAPRRRLLAAAATAVLRSPRRAIPALAWTARAVWGERRLGHLKQFGEAAWVARRIPRDTEHVHAHFAHAPASVALLVSRLTGVPFSFTGHANDIFRLVSPPLLRSKMAEASLVVAVSEHTRTHLVGLARGTDAAKVVVVRNGIDLGRFAPRPGVATAEPLLLSVSRLVAKKGVDTLFEACALLMRRGVRVRCEVVGDGPLRDELMRRARELGVSERVQLLGYQDECAVLAAYRRATALVLACRQASNGDRDGLPMAIVEAMACGLPVITTPISGIPEVVADGRSGLLVPPDAPAALASAVERLVEEPALRARLARCGPLAVATAFDQRATVARLRALFAAPPDVASTPGVAGPSTDRRVATPGEPEHAAPASA
jgi:glycosyltransferase involved in cell wall biosynthesis